MVLETISSIIVIIWLLLILSIFRTPNIWKDKGIRIDIQNKRLNQLFEDRKINTPEKRGLFWAILVAIISLIFSPQITGFNLFFVLLAGALLGQKFGSFSMLTVISVYILQNSQGMYGGYYYNEIYVLISLFVPIISAYVVGWMLENNTNNKLNAYIKIMSVGWGILYLPTIILFPNYSLDQLFNQLFNNAIIICIFAYVYQKIETGKGILPAQLWSEDSDRIDPKKVQPEILTNFENVPHVTETLATFSTFIIEVKNSINKEALRDINVTLKHVDGEIFEHKSDVDGKVIFGKLKDGNYTLLINSQGFSEIAQEITLNKNEKITIELEGKANLLINVKDIVNEAKIADAIIKLGDREIRTDEKGIAIISDVPFGKYDLTVTKETYNTESRSHIIKEIQQDLNIYLKLDIKLNEEYATKGEQLKNSLNESMKKLSLACDMGIPEFYKNICFELIKFDEIIALTPAYIYADQSKDKINALYKITGIICKEMELILTNSENISEFISMADRGIKTTPKITINPADYENLVQAYMKDPADFISKYNTQIRNKLNETDKEITDKLRLFNINPIANIWSISQNITAQSKNEYEDAVSLLMANILLDATKNMFKTYDIITRLKT